MTTKATLVDAVHTVKTVHRDDRGQIERVDEVAAPERAIPLSMVTDAIRDLVDGKLFAERLQATLDAVLAELEAKGEIMRVSLVPAVIDAWLDRHAKPLPEPESREFAVDYFSRTRAMIQDGHFTAQIFDLPKSFWDKNDEKEGTQK
jgi:hypothetical protein